MQQHDPLLRPYDHRTAILVVSISLLAILSCCVTVVAHRPTRVAARTQVDSPTTNPVVGIDVPVGAVLNHLPPAMRDYIRRTWPGLLPEPPVTNPELGIDLPVGATHSDLPVGVSDYLRDQTPEPPP